MLEIKVIKGTKLFIIVYNEIKAVKFTDGQSLHFDVYKDSQPHPTIIKWKE